MIGRRSFVRTLLAAPLVGCAVTPLQSAPRTVPLPPGRRLKVLCVGAHPDDPESGCGGTLSRYAEAGHDVALLYLTGGERGVAGKTSEESARTRMAEARDACAILGAKAIFAGQVSGDVQVTQARTDEFRRIFDGEKADVVFGHWPLDTEWEHQAAAILTLRAYLATPRAVPLYLYEVQSGAQTLGFAPTAYVDISKTREKKTQALRAHKSQSFERLYEEHHEKIEAFRGRELGVFAAEAFATLGPDATSGALPGI